MPDFGTSPLRRVPTMRSSARPLNTSLVRMLRSRGSGALFDNRPILIEMSSEGWLPRQGRIDGPYTWLLIAAEREVAAWAARRGRCDRVSPLLAGDPLAGEFHACLVSVTASAFSIEALHRETIQRLRESPDREQDWKPPAVAKLESRRRSKRGRVADWERALLTLHHDRVIDASPSWSDEFNWLFRARNAVVHFDTHWEELAEAQEQQVIPLPTMGEYRAESATRAVNVARSVIQAAGITDLQILDEHRPDSPWFERLYGDASSEGPEAGTV